MRVTRGAAAMAAAAMAAALVVACAQPGAPPGGPPDPTPPRLLDVSPDTGAVNVTARRVDFRFDEVVSERVQGATTLGGLFLVSPYDGEADVEWHRDRIEVKPAKGFRRNTVYYVTMLPGIADLRGNVRREGASVVFSTGPTIPDTRVTGIAFDWMAQRPIQKGFIEAIAPDSTRYVTVADSLGRFTLRHLPAGRYVVRAFADANANRSLEPREAWDSTSVTAAEGTGADTVSAPSVELLAFVHDTIGPRIASVTVRDSVTLRVEFDKGILPSQTLAAAAFTLRKSDSTMVAIARAEPATVAEERAAREREEAARRDTTMRADSIDRERRGDSVRTARQLDRGLPPNVKPPRGGAVAAGDTSGPRPSRPAPQLAYEIGLAESLAAGTTYRLRATDVRNLLGYARSSDRAFTTPKATPRDTSAAGRAARDSAGAAGRPPAVPGQQPPTPPRPGAPKPAAPARRP